MPESVGSLGLPVPHIRVRPLATLDGPLEAVMDTPQQNDPGLGSNCAPRDHRPGRGRTEGAAREIRAASGGQVDAFVADLSSQSQVRRLADEVLQRLSRIDVLVNNVGGYWHTRHVTADGLERTFALNHLAPFLLTNLLLDRLQHSAPARVVTVSSSAHAQGRIDLGVAPLQGLADLVPSWRAPANRWGVHRTGASPR
jgi:hypothetical protein